MLFFFLHCIISCEDIDDFCFGLFVDGLLDGLYLVFKEVARLLREGMIVVDNV